MLGRRPRADDCPSDASSVTSRRTPWRVRSFMSEEKAVDLYGGVDNLEIMAEARNYNAFLGQLVRGAARPGDRILDFGAGAGDFAAPLAAEGWRVECVEPDPRLRERLRLRGLPALPAIDAVPPASLDYVYTLNVLEHIADDAAALAAICDRLRPGGRLLVYVPAFPILFSSMDRKVGHVRRYRKRLLVGRLAAAGFAVDTATYCDSLGFLASLLFKAIGNDAGEINRRALILYDRLAFPPSRLIDRAAGPFFGKNLLALARRR
jgi:SAM-dependent methyltransferase